MPIPSALESLDAWRRAPAGERRTTVAAIAEALGSDYSAGDEPVGEERFGSVVHAATEAELVLLPATRFHMGASDDDVAALLAVMEPMARREWGDIDTVLEEAGVDSLDAYFLGAWEPMIAQMRPVHEVVLPPFLLGRDRVGGRWPEGWRLPSEAEWELIAREGGQRRLLATVHGMDIDPEEVNAWGFAALLEPPEPVADRWNATHEGAPADGRARGGGKKESMRGLTHEWQDLEEAIMLLTAWRAPLDRYAITGRRPAMDLPG